MTPTVTSLDLSRKLRDAGYKQKGYWCHQWNCLSVHYLLRETKKAKNASYPFEHYYIAPLADEVLGRLPIEIKHREKGVLCLAIWRRNNGDWFVWYDNAHKIDDWFLHREIADTLCNAASKMYLYLAGKGLIKA